MCGGRIFLPVAEFFGGSGKTEHYNWTTSPQYTGMYTGTVLFEAVVYVLALPY
jgi:hypothetical protein